MGHSWTMLAVAASLASCTATVPAGASVVLLLDTQVVNHPNEIVNFDGLPSGYDLNSFAHDGIAFNSLLTSEGAFAVHNTTSPDWADFAILGFTSSVGYFTEDSGHLFQYLSIKSDNGSNFSAMQFVLGSGYAGNMNGYWEAELNGVNVGSGSFEIDAYIPGNGILAPATLVGFSGGKFDEIKIGVYAYPFSTFDFTGVNGNAAEVANIEAMIPEPSTWAMMLLGFATLGFAGYRRQVKAMRRLPSTHARSKAERASVARCGAGRAIQGAAGFSALGIADRAPTRY